MIKTIDAKSLKTELLAIERWEDEGGHMNEHNDLMTDPLLVQTVPINTERHDRSLPWKERFVIEPFRPGNGIFLIRIKHTTKTD